MSQMCKDCNGRGWFYGTGEVRHPDCPTCEGKGGILRTGPYKLKDGTWSDGVDRSEPIGTSDGPIRRWEVWRDSFGDWIAYCYGHTAFGYEGQEFPTHAEAIAYADRMARTNPGETK